LFLRVYPDGTKQQQLILASKFRARQKDNMGSASEKIPRVMSMECGAAKAGIPPKITLIDFTFC
jgi:hypothetical protein